MPEPQLPNKNPPLDKRLLELTALFEMSRALTSTLNLHAILDNVLRIPMGHMLISRGVILLKKESDDVFTVEALKGVPRNLLGKTLEIADPPQSSITVGEIPDDNGWIALFKKFELELLTPLISSQGPIGLLVFGPKISCEPYEEDEIEFLDSLSNIAATSVANGVMVHEIQDVNRRLDRKIQQLNTIFDISRELNTTLDQDKIGSLLGFAVMGELLVNKCVVFIKKDGHLQPLISKGVELPTKMLDGELSDLSEPLLLEDADRFDAYIEKGLAVAVPMRSQQQTRGVMLVGSKITGGFFDEAEIEFLSILGNQAMTAIENARLFEETLEKQRLEEEMNLARSIQQGLLPKTIPIISGYELAGCNIPSRQVGGDYYDIIRISENQYGIAIGDVSGKGPGAALLMANLQAALQAHVSSRIAMEAMMSRLNNQIFQNTAIDKYITFFYGELNTEENTFTYCNAGHNFPYHLKSSGDICELQDGGLILGMMQDMTYKTSSLRMETGDCVVMYTDGITEEMDADDEEYGEDRLQNCILSYLQNGADVLMQAVLDDVKGYSVSNNQSDDMTMVVIKCLE